LIDVACGPDGNGTDFKQKNNSGFVGLGEQSKPNPT
jgi:hypothetical protein